MKMASSRLFTFHGMIKTKAKYRCCKGRYSGALTNRIFNINIVNEKNGTGISLSQHYNKTVKYTGKAMVVSLK